jgi:hypothetical protein
MISSKSRDKDWIIGIREKAQIRIDPRLIEKTILALILVENLNNIGLDFTFKGGTSLILVLNSLRRLSIDVDIVLETEKGLEEALQKVLQQGIFHRFEKDQRSSSIPKCHYKFFFISAIDNRESSILLDILFEGNPYLAYQKIPIKSDLIVNEGIPNSVNCPTPECLLGDKLTAFAPHTTGILYGKDKDLEIIKQLYDIGLLFDSVNDLKMVAETFHSVATKELIYRRQSLLSPAGVLTDCFNTACLVGMRGFDHMDEYAELQMGIKKLSGFIYAEHFTMDSAILCAAKAAYMATLIRKGAQEVSRFNSGDNLTDWTIKPPEYSKLNKVKKTSPEAFYYFYQALKD